MSTDTKNLCEVDYEGLAVVNLAHDGYRRAGFTLKTGENILPMVDCKTFNALDNDPRLVVTIIASMPGDNPPGSMDDVVLPDRITVEADNPFAQLDIVSADPFPVDVELSDGLTLKEGDGPVVPLDTVITEPLLDIITTPFPDNAPLTGEQELPSPEERLQSAVMAAKIEPREKWFTKTGSPRLEQWRDFVRADLTAADIKAALAAQGVQ